MVDIWWYGQSCFKVKGKNVSVVFDPYDPQFTGLSPLKLEADIVCVSHNHRDHNYVEAVKGVSGSESPSGPSGPEGPPGQRPFVISGPGEYEKSGANIVGVISFHDNQEGSQRGKNVIYNLTIDEVNVVHLGDLGQKKLTQEQVETLSACDILLVPVGSVYTIDGRDAPDIISQIEPKIIVPMHYKIDGLKFDLVAVGDFLKAMGKEGLEPVNKLSISKDRLPEEPEVILLEKQK